MQRRMIMLLSQMSAFFAEREGGEIEILKLMKLLYLTERESFRRRGRSITNDEMYSLPHGPILSKAYDLARHKANPREQHEWNKWFAERASGDVNVKLRCPVSMDELDYFSQRDEEMVNNIWNQFGKMSAWQLRNYTHEHCKEWIDPHGSCKRIEEIDVLRAVGVEEEEALGLAEAIKDDKALCRAYAE